MGGRQVPVEERRARLRGDCLALAVLDVDVPVLTFNQAALLCQHL